MRQNRESRIADASRTGTEIVAGLNLAVVYGFGLIVLAMILALIYNWLCTRKEKELFAKQNEEEQIS